MLIFTALHFEADGIRRAIGGRDRFSIHVIGPAATRMPIDPSIGCAGVILAGLSGGLSPELKRGDILIDDRSTLQLASPYRRVKFVTADRVIATPADKARLHDETGGAVVDMETDTVRAWAESRGLPWMSIRAISDTAHESLDPAVLRFVDPDGHNRPAWIVRELLKKPSLITTLWRLRHSGRIVQQLGEAIIPFLNDGSV